MVVESNGAAAAVRPSDRPVLAEVAVVFGPELVLGAVAVVVSKERLAGVVRRVVCCEGLYDVELNEGVLRESIQGEI